ncbi:hypothetical protein UPYG_G00240900 [Umbra pygmaea]|uniref:Uncharacterized protein n=1 Tax=Umbra pygmaea TaxID=75934 RepID=A0ABD0WZH8_UMBPY
MFQTISRIWRCPPLPKRKHRCSQGFHPEESFVPTPGDMVSEYQEKYPAHCVSVVRTTKKPKDQYLPLQGKTSYMTTYKADYVAHEVTLRSPNITNVYVRPESRMRHRSSYAIDYPAHSVQEKQSVTKSAYHPPTEKMHTQSVYKEDFRAWDYQKVKTHRTSDNLKWNDCEFEGTLAFHGEQFHKGLAEVTDSSRPDIDIRETLNSKNAPNYQTKCTHHPVQPRQLKEKVISKPKMIQRTVSFKSSENLPSNQSMDEGSVDTLNEGSSCPARNDSPPGFGYSSARAGGHRLYRTISVEETGLGQMATATGEERSQSQCWKSCIVPSRAKRAP